MSCLVHVAVHASQFPEEVRRGLLESLRTRRVNPKFHYDSVRQSEQWMAVHRAWSPSRNDDECVPMYDQSFEAAAARIKARRVHVIGLGCGGGQKDTRLLHRLRAEGREVSYTPCDASVALVLVARRAALAAVPEEHCTPLVCDLAVAGDLPVLFRRRQPPNTPRLITCFGMIPNFAPQVLMPKLAALVRRSDYLLFSANLAPGGDYAAGVNRILPQYDNPLTRDWLMTVLLDLGVERSDGRLRFCVESGGPAGRLKRVSAYFTFARAREIRVDRTRFHFRRGERILVFFSYRYTPGLVSSLLRRHGLRVLDQWTARSAEEGVYLCERSDVSAFDTGAGAR